MAAIPTVKVKHDSEIGYQIVNECDLTPEMEIYRKPSDDVEPEAKPVVTPKKKAPVKA